MKLEQAKKEITRIKQEEPSYTDLGRALGFTRQYAQQIKDKDLSEEQIRSLEEYFKVNLAIDNPEDIKNENDATQRFIESIEKICESVIEKKITAEFIEELLANKVKK